MQAKYIAVTQLVTLYRGPGNTVATATDIDGVDQKMSVAGGFSERFFLLGAGVVDDLNIDQAQLVVVAFASNSGDVR